MLSTHQKRKFYGLKEYLVKKEFINGRTVTFNNLVDFSQVENLRALYDKEYNVKPTYNAILLKAYGLAVKEFPYVNRKCSEVS